MELDPATVETLVQSALQVRRRAYAPYSNFYVGAAILTDAGELYAGCNVEIASLGLTTCAERAAVCAAVAAGATKIVGAAVVAAGGPSPCGACRQILAEFGPTMTVALVDADDETARRITTLDRLLPDQFRLKDDR